MSKTRDVIYIFLLLVLILLLWTGLSLLPGPAEVQLPEVMGGYDLTGYDFEDTVYITAPCWDSWPERLYAPEAQPLPKLQRSAIALILREYSMLPTGWFSI